MDLQIGIVISIAALLFIAIILMIFIRTKSKIKYPTDYHNLFIIGIIWLSAGIPIGVTTKNYGLMALGLIFMAVGMLNKKKWKKNKKEIQKLQEKHPEYFKTKKIIIGILLLLLIIGIAVYWFLK